MFKIQLKTLRIFQILFLTVIVFTLPACSRSDMLYEESYTSEERMQVSQERYYEAFDVEAFDQSVLDSVSSHYSRHGSDGMNVSVSYDPHSKDFSSLDASEKVAEISNGLRGSGLHDVDLGIFPVQGQAPQVIVSYTAFQAHGPENCEKMPGSGGNSVLEQSEDYKLGCTVEKLFAKQIARPKDLKGQEGTDLIHDGRRLANTIDRYRDGIPNEGLNGESASDQN